MAQAWPRLRGRAAHPFWRWPRFHFFAVLWLTLPVLVFLIEAEPEEIPSAAPPSRWQQFKAHRCFAAAGAGWWFGFGYFFAGLVWVAEAFLVEAQQFAILIPLVISGLPGFAGPVLGRRRRPLHGPRTCPDRHVCCFSQPRLGSRNMRVAMSSRDCRGMCSLCPHAASAADASAAYAGIYGLTLGTVPIFALPMVLWAQARTGPLGRRNRLAAVAIAVLPLSVMALLGSWRLATPHAAPAVAAKIRIVQPSVPQKEKWRPENQERIFNDHLELSQTNPLACANAMPGITHVVWPEAAMPFLPLEYPVALKAIGNILAPGRKSSRARCARTMPATALSAGARRSTIHCSCLAQGARW